MTTAFVLSGGGSLGAVQVGMLQALAERSVTPDLLVGTSAGALNAVFVAAHGTSPAALDRLAATWAALRRDDVFPLRGPQMVLALTGARDALCADSGLERLVRRHVRFARLEALNLLIQRRLITDVALYADRVELVVLPPLCPLRISAIDFRHAAELCRRAHTSSARWLDGGETSLPRPERILGMHGHQARHEDGADLPA
jgi:predicted acylesterase/phospholipase RssA